MSESMSIVARWYGGMAAVLVSGLFLAESVHAQTGQYAAQDFEIARAPQYEPAGKVSAKYVSTPLATVLDDIAKRAGVRVSYNETVASSSARVTAEFSGAKVADVLASVLKGTGLMAVRVGDAQWGITKTQSVEQGTVIGRVVHAKTKQPLSGVTVSAGDGKLNVTTGEDGRFRISLEAGEHTLTVRAVGFVRQTRRVVVAEGKDLELEIVMEPSASVLDEVIVTGTMVATERRAIPTPITVVTADDIEKRNITRIEDLFRGQVPGVIALEEGTMRYGGKAELELGGVETSRIYSRGSASLDGSPNPMKTFIDGVELLDASYLGTIDPKSIERIEIITGPQAATIYGAGAMGGVMQIFTKKGSSTTVPEVTLNLGYGILQNDFSDNLTPSHNHVLNIAGGPGKIFTYSGTISYRYSGAWQPYLFTRLIGSSLGSVHSSGPFTVSGSVSITSSANGTARAGGTCFINNAWDGCRSSMYLVNAQQAGDRTVTNLGGSFGQTISRSASQTLSLSADYRQTGAIAHHLSIGRNQTSSSLDPERPVYGTPRDTLLAEQVRNGQRTSFNYNATFRSVFGLSTNHFIIGATGSTAKTISAKGDLATSYSTSYGNSIVTKTIGDESWGGFASWQLGLFDQVFLSLGLRGETNPNYGSKHKMDWTPVNGLTYTFEYRDIAIKLLGSYGRTTRTPDAEMRLAKISSMPAWNIEQYLSQAEAPTLRPEYSQGPQGGVEIYYGNVASLTVTHYRQSITDLIQANPIDSVLGTVNGYPVSYVYTQQYQNVGKMLQRGWEGVGALSVGPLTLRGTWSWNDSRIVSFNTLYAGTYYSGQSAAWVPTHTGSVIVGYVKGATSVTWTTNVIGSVVRPNQYNRDIQSIMTIREEMYRGRSRSGLIPTSTGGYSKSDMTMRQRITPWMSATLNVSNVTNTYESDVGGLWPALGRTTLIGISLRHTGR